MFFFDGISCSAKPCWRKLQRLYPLCALFLSSIAIISVKHIIVLTLIIVLIVVLVRLLEVSI